MKLTKRYDEALGFAADLHREHTRKGPVKFPYLSHLLSVSALVMEHGGDEDQAIAALLHDAIEDQGDTYPGGRRVLRKQIKAQFGSSVLNIVNACTDDDEIQRSPPDASLSPAEIREGWLERKRAYIRKVGHEAQPVIRVSCADKLHNARCIIVDYRKEGERLWQRFTTKSKDDQMWYYNQLVKAFGERAREFGDAGIDTLVKELHLTVLDIQMFSIMTAGAD